MEEVEALYALGMNSVMKSSQRWKSQKSVWYVNPCDSAMEIKLGLTYQGKHRDAKH